jgi:hypothetical protein
MKFKERKYKYLTKAMRLYLINLVKADMHKFRHEPLQQEIIELLESDDINQNGKEENE